SENLEEALEQAIDYCEKLRAPLAFATNDYFLIAYHVIEKKVLKIDGAEIQQFLNEKILLDFVEQGAEITLNPVSENLTKEEVLAILKRVNRLLRKEGLRTGLERFSAISDLIFMKLLNDKSDAAEFVGNRSLKIDDKSSYYNLIIKIDNEKVD